MILLGLDPGVNGAAAAIDDAGVLVGLHDFPTLELPGSGTIRRRLDGQGLVRIMRELVPDTAHAVAYLEDVQAWAPKPRFAKGGEDDEQRGAGTSQIAAMIGAKYQLFTVLDLFRSRITVVLVQPRVWKAHFALKRGENETTAAFKHRSRAKARELYPDARLPRDSANGRAEALLIACFGRHAQGYRDDLATPVAPAAPRVDELQQEVFG